MCAEVVLLFEACNEQGNMFSTRQSYLPSEIHWGHTFVPIISPAAPGETRHRVNISRWAGGMLAPMRV